MFTLVTFPKEGDPHYMMNLSELKVRANVSRSIFEEMELNIGLDASLNNWLMDGTEHFYGSDFNNRIFYIARENTDG